MQSARENSGIMEGAAETAIDVDELVASSRSEENPDTEEPDKGSEDEEEPEDEKQDKGKPQSRRARVAPSGQEKAIFAQLKDTNRAIANLASIVEKIVQKPEAAPTVPQTEKQEIISDEVREFAKGIAEKQGLDPEALTELVKGILQLSSKERATLPEDVKQTLEVVKDLEAEEAKRKDQAALAENLAEFDDEWRGFEPMLRKQYPNASSSELSQAKDIMIQIAHSEKGGVVIDEKNHILKGYPLDYILFKDIDGVKSKFDTILKVAPKGKGAEGGTSKDMNDDIPLEDDDIDLDIENMTPEKFKRREQQRIRQADKDRGKVQHIG